MATLTKTALFAGFDTNIDANANNEITGPILNAELKNIGDSYPNKLDEDHYFLREYLETRAYQIGFVALESEQLYKCTTPTSGVFNPAHWDAQNPPLTITDVYVVADIAARDALTVQQGDVAKVTDSVADTGFAGKPQTYIWDGAAWIDIQETSDVVTVNGATGTVVLDTDDIAEGAALYHTSERVDDRVAALIQDGTGLAWTYVDGSNTLTGNITGLTVTEFASANVSQWTNDAAYLTSFVETDPVFLAHPAFSVTNAGGGTNFLADDGTYKVVAGANIYTTDDTLTGARTMTMGAFSLLLQSGGGETVQFTDDGRIIADSNSGPQIFEGGANNGTQLRTSNSAVGTNNFLTFYMRDSATTYVSYAGIASYVAVNTAGAHEGGLRIRTADGAGGNPVVMTVDPDGNVDIGSGTITTVDARFRVKGAGFGTGIMIRYENSAGFDRFIMQDDGHTKLLVAAGNGFHILNADGSENRILMVNNATDDGEIGLYDNLNALNTLISSVGDSYFTGGDVGFGTITNPSEDVHASDTIRADTAFSLNGSDGIGAIGGTTYTFGGGGTGDIATMTFRGGILTAITLVP